MEPEVKYLKPSEVAQALGLTVRGVYSLLDRGELVGIRVGNQWRVDSDSVRRLGEGPAEAGVRL